MPKWQTQVTFLLQNVKLSARNGARIVHCHVWGGGGVFAALQQRLLLVEQAGTIMQLGAQCTALNACCPLLTCQMTVLQPMEAKSMVGGSR